VGKPKKVALDLKGSFSEGKIEGSMTIGERNARVTDGNCTFEVK
jgi:hypothetical protein